MPTGNEPEKTPQMSLPLLAGGALGVVFGDIGTSPLYTLKTVLFLSGDPRPVVADFLDAGDICRATRWWKSAAGCQCEPFGYRLKSMVI